MTEFTNADRMVLDLESRLWVVVSILDQAEPRGFRKNVSLLKEMAHSLAMEIRDYNDQFEESE